MQDEHKWYEEQIEKLEKRETKKRDWNFTMVNLIADAWISALMMRIDNVTGLLNYAKYFAIWFLPCSVATLAMLIPTEAAQYEGIDENKAKLIFWLLFMIALPYLVFFT